MKVFHLEAEGASPEELEAIKVAIGENASEIFSLDARSSSQFESKPGIFLYFRTFSHHNGLIGSPIDVIAMDQTVLCLFVAAWST